MDLKKVDLYKLQDYAFTANEIAIRKPSIASNSKFINIKCLDNESIVPTINAIPLDKVKQVREEIYQRGYYTNMLGLEVKQNLNPEDILEILDELIAESEN